MNRFLSILLSVFLLGSVVSTGWSTARAQTRSGPVSDHAPATRRASQNLSDERLKRIKDMHQSVSVFRWALDDIDTEESIYVNAVSGEDKNSCGPQPKPCRTIATALKRAR